MTDSGSNATEDQALDRALEEATPLLAESLKRDEQTRRRRRRLMAGGLFMFVIGSTLVTALVFSTGAPDSPPTNPVSQVQAYESAVESGALGQKAWQLWSQGEYGEASKLFFQAIKADPEAPNHWNGLGWSLFHLGKHDKAADAFKETLKLDENWPGALNGMGQIAFAKKDYTQAKKWFLKAPHAPAAQHSLVKVHLLLGEYNEAAALSDTLLAQLPEDSTDQNIQSQRAWLTQLHDAAVANDLPDSLQQQIEPAPEPEPETAGEVTASQEPPANNVLVNGGFEKGTDGWIIGSNSDRMTLTPDKDVKTEGEQSLRITKTQGMPIDIVRINAKDLEPGLSVNVSAKIKTQDVGNAWMKFYVWDEDGNVLIENLDVTRIHGTHDWRIAKRRFILPDDTDSVAIQFWMILDGTVWIDDVRVEPVE